jgi:ATP-dependent DNA helicase RecQ
VVFSDATLQEMAAERPVSRVGMLGISGVGMKKFETYGEAFIKLILEHGGGQYVPSDSDSMFNEPRPRLAVADKTAAADKPVSDSEDATVQFHQMGLSPEDISERRGLALSTVKTHLYTAYAKGRELRIHDFVSDSELAEILTARAQLGNDASLRDLFDHLREKYDYFQLRMAALYHKRLRGQ